MMLFAGSIFPTSLLAPSTRQY